MYFTTFKRRIGHEVYRESPPSNPSEFMDNHTWFNKGVTRWLDIALYKVGYMGSRLNM